MSDWYELRTGWPECVVWKEDPFEVVFVENKIRNTALKPDKITLLRLLERLGLNVRIACTGRIEDAITLDEYLQGGMSKFRALSSQNVLNYRHEIKVMKEEHDRMPEGDPRRVELWDKIMRREQMLPPEKRILPQLGAQQNQVDYWSPQAREERAKKRLKEAADAKKEDVG